MSPALSGCGGFLCRRRRFADRPRRGVFRPGYRYAILDVAMWFADNGWAVGYYRKGKDYEGRVWRCREGTWHGCACPVRYTLSNIEFISPIEAWDLTYGKILHYTTEPNIAPASLGRIKALYAGAVGPDSGYGYSCTFATPAAGGPPPPRRRGEKPNRTLLKCPKRKTNEVAPDLNSYRRRQRPNKPISPVDRNGVLYTPQLRHM
jgi:hypothetical protein